MKLTYSMTATLIRLVKKRQGSTGSMIPSEIVNRRSQNINITHNTVDTVIREMKYDEPHANFESASWKAAVKDIAADSNKIDPNRSIRPSFAAFELFLAFSLAWS
jgi:hypothetical protein